MVTPLCLLVSLAAAAKPAAKPAAPASAITFAKQAEVQTPGAVFSLRYSPDGRFLVTGHAKGAVTVWDAATQNRVKLFRAHSGEGNNSIAFSPDGKRMATASFEGVHSISIWDTETWKELERIKGSGMDLVFLPSGDGLIGRFDDRVTLWELPGGRARLLWNGPAKRIADENTYAGERWDFVESLSLSEDGQTLAVARNDLDHNDTLLTIDVASAERLAVFPSKPQSRVALGGSRLASWGQEGVEMRDVRSGGLLWSARDASGYGTFAFTPDARHLAIAEVSGALRFLDAETGKEAAVFSEPGWPRAFAPSGRQLAVVASEKLYFYSVTGIGGKAGAPVAPPSIAAAPAKPAAAPAPLDVDQPPASRAPVDPDAFAVVVGVERYRQKAIPAVEFAVRDAETLKSYLTGSMGFDEANVVLLRNEEATKTDLEKYLGPWLKNRATPKSRIFVYFAGHGSPNPATGDAFLMPYEGDPQYAEVTAFPIKSLWSTLAKLPSKETTVVLDACFSGQGERSVIARGTRPLVAVKTDAYQGAGKAAVIAAAMGAQVSTHYPEARHGLLTYFLLRGLQGEADADKDGAITTGELFAYAKPQVERQARLQNLEQTPTLSGPASAVWLKSPKK